MSWFPADYATLAGLVSAFVVENELQERRDAEMDHGDSADEDDSDEEY